MVKLDPSTGTRVILDAHRADKQGPQAITLDMEFADEGGEAPTPYEVLLLDALRRRQRAFHAPGQRGGDLAHHRSHCSTRRRLCTLTRLGRGGRRRASA